mmetsp:Transcript_87022/g.244015  ORF Transcript_87022/g.244015 Transcript_87022/m.244015 type:complete len:208 (+) Transcript_87022:1389-2012(+)
MVARHSRFKMPSVMMFLVFSARRSVRRKQICKAVSPSKFFMSRFAITSTRCLVASSQPRATVCIRGVQLLWSVELTSKPRSSRQLTVTVSSSMAAKCKALKPSRSLAAMSALAKTKDARSCQFPSRAAMCNAVMPILLTALTSSAGMTNSSLFPSLFWRIMFTRSRWPDSQACIRKVFPSLSTASALHMAPSPVSCNNETTQAKCPP